LDIPGVEVELVVTLSAKNVDHYPQAFAAARREIPDLAYGDFHVNIVHESSHYLGNTELGLRSRVGAEALARATEGYAQLRGRARSPVDFLERAYLKRVRRYVETGATPMRCHALRASCFVDSWGNVFPCTVYDRRISNPREVDYARTAGRLVRRTRASSGTSCARCCLGSSGIAPDPPSARRDL